MTNPILHVPSWSRATGRSLDNRSRLAQSITRKNILSREEPSAEIHPPEHCTMDPNPIVSVEFLDSHQTVLSADSYGKISVHRLPVGKESELQKVLELPPLQDEMTLVKLFPLSDGRSFCVGLPNGDYNVYSRDRWSNPGTIPLADTLSSNPSNYKGYQIRGARRRYHRSFRQPLWSSITATTEKQQSMIDGQSHHQHHHQLSEICDWNARHRRLTRPKSYDWLQNTRALPGRYPTVDDEDARWAFRETSSSILAAHIDPELDCFTLLDHRHTPQKPVVYCKAPTAEEEDMTAVCFVSDHSVLTSHVWKKRTSTPDNSLHLWDIRMSNKPVLVVKDDLSTSPSFPYDTIRNCTPDMNWLVTEEEEDGKSGVSPATATAKLPLSRIQRITRLVSNNHNRNVGTVMITLTSDTSTELLLYDLIHNKILFRHSTDDNEMSSSCLHTPQPPLVAVSSSLLVATTETMSGARTKLSLYNPTAASTRTTRKRPAKSPPSLVGSTLYGLEDRFGIRTRLSSLAWNASGTSLVGGSLDGDVFVWE